MRILVVDDEQVRHNGYRLRHHSDEVVSAFNAYEALEQLQQGSFDIAYLDHNMGSGWPDGVELAKKILGLPRENWPKRVIVHSWNKDGAQRMIDLFATACLPAVYRRYQG